MADISKVIGNLRREYQNSGSTGTFEDFLVEFDNPEVLDFYRAYQAYYDPNIQNNVNSPEARQLKATLDKAQGALENSDLTIPNTSGSTITPSGSVEDDIVAEYEARDKQRRAAINEENSARATAKDEQLRKATNLYYGTSAANNLAGAMQALGQVSQGRKALEELRQRRPQAPEFERNERLQQALGNAQRAAAQGLDPSSRTLYSSMVDEAEANARRRALAGSGGNLGLYTAQAGRAQADTIRAAYEAMKANEQAKRANVANYGSLVTQEMTEDMAKRQQDQAEYGRRYREYMGALQNAQQLKKAGYLNFARKMQEVPSMAYYMQKNAPVDQGQGFRDAMNKVGGWFRRDDASSTPPTSAYGWGNPSNFNQPTITPASPNLRTISSYSTIPPVQGTVQGYPQGTQVTLPPSTVDPYTGFTTQNPW